MTPVPPEAHAALRALYAELATELDAYRRHCEMRGNCCNFAALGHMLYVTALEAAEMAASGVATNPLHANEGKCPYLQGSLCGLREHRAIGCRIYYCDKTYEEERNALGEKYLRLAREIETRFGIEHCYMPVTQVEFEAVK